VWWSDIGIYKFPILARMAGRVLAAQPTSAETERLFSISGRVLCKARMALSYYHVNELVCLHNWLQRDLKEGEKRRDAKRMNKTQQFATLSLEMELISPPADDEDDDLEDEEPDEIARLTREQRRLAARRQIIINM
jgi:hypothetical protein